MEQLPRRFERITRTPAGERPPLAPLREEGITRALDLGHVLMGAWEMPGGDLGPPRAWAMLCRTACARCGEEVRIDRRYGLDGMTLVLRLSAPADRCGEGRQRR